MSKTRELLNADDVAINIEIAEEQIKNVHPNFLCLLDFSCTYFPNRKMPYEITKYFEFSSNTL